MSGRTRRTKVPPWFGQRVRRERERRGLTLEALGGKCCLDAATIMRTEKGQDPAFSTAIALSAGLGLSLDALLTPMPCGTCDGMPPAGFICSECGRGGAAGEAV